MSLKHWISDLHYRREQRLSPWLWLLLPLSLAYRFGVSVRLKAYELGVLRASEPSVPVISIGNLTTGGTGKTPLVIELARGLIAAGKTVVVLSRGYGAAEPTPYARALEPRYGDEAYLIQAQVPEAVVIAGKDRVHTLNQAVKDYHPDFVLLDDGFQYLPLQRHLNVLLIDGERLLGNERLLPAGPLREPISALQRADLILVTKQVSTASMQAVNRFLAEADKKPSPTVLPVPFQASGLAPLQPEQGKLPVSALKDRAVIAVSGIAQPEQFEQDLREAGARLIRHCRFSDHHNYTQADIDRLVDLAERHASQSPLLVTTEKDLVKAAPFIPTAWRPFVYALQVKPALDGKWFYSEFITQMIGKIPESTVDVR
jgi:tetraacyldisaccharide 4'-kinase